MKTIATTALILISIFAFGQNKEEVPVIETRATKKDSVLMTELQKAEFAEINKLKADYEEAFKKALQELQTRQNHSLMLILDAKGFKLDAIVPSSLTFKNDKILFTTKTK